MRFAVRHAAFVLPANVGAMLSHLAHASIAPPSADASARLGSQDCAFGPLARLLGGLGLALILCAGGSAGVAHAASPNDSLAVLSWEAPGDDGATGVATRYELRYRITAVAGTDTLGWWNSATSLATLPIPSAAGVTDSVVVRGLNPGLNYYFMLRVADEVPNWSGFSNLVGVTALYDTTAPATINDLRVEESGPEPRSAIEDEAKVPPK